MHFQLELARVESGAKVRIIDRCKKKPKCRILLLGPVVNPGQTFHAIASVGNPATWPTMADRSEAA
jgi:hypothetical protein